MKTKSIKTHARWLTCLIALAVIFATFLTGMGTSASASTDVFESIELKVGDTLGFVYYTTQPYNSNTKMRFEINGRQSIAPAYPNDGKCVFVFNDVYPHELGKDIKATIVVNGKDTITTSGLSVKKYLLELLLDNSQPDKIHKFASNVLQYGEATRLYRNEHIDPSERDTKKILDFDETIYTNYNPDPIDTVWNGTAPGLGTSAANVRLASIGIAYHNTNHYVLTLKTPANSVVSLNNVKVLVKVGTVTTTYDSSKFVDKGNGEYELRTNPINGHSITDSVQFTLQVNGSTVQQASYSPYDYVYQLQSTNSNALALRYAKSLCKYGEAAKAAYGGNVLRVIAVDCKTAPNNVTVTNKNVVTPAGGSLLVHYSDGSSATLTSGFTWDTTDYETGTQVKITDDTYQKTFKVLGRYTDPVSGKTYTVKSRITLSNPMTSIARYNDANTYIPSSHVNSHTPVGATVKCTWSNGYTSVRGASNGVTFSAVDTSGLATTEYAQLKSTATYKDPKSGVTKTTNIYVMYENPIQTITISNTSFTMSGGSTNVTPAHTTFNVTYKNTKSTTGLSTNQTAFKWSALKYEGTNTSDTVTATGTYTTPASSSYTVYKNGSSSTKKYDARTISDTCSVAISNPEKSISIITAPTVKGGQVTSTAAPVSGSNNGNLTGGVTHVTLANGKSKAVTATYSCSAGIIDSTYSKSVTVTAKYNGMTASNKSITLYNDVVSMSQSTTPSLGITVSTTNVQVPLSTAGGCFTLKFSNGVTIPVSPTHLLVNGTVRDTACYVQSIRTAGASSATRTTATTSNSSTSYSALTASWVHGNSGTTVTSPFKVEVYTYATGIVGGQSTGSVTMTSATSVPTPANKALNVSFSNGTTGSYTCSFSNPGVATNADEYQDRSVTAYYTDARGNQVSVTGVACRVINPAKSAVTYTDPNPITINTTSAYTSFSGGQITVTFMNGKTAVKNCTSYSGSAAITNTNMIERDNISGKWTGSYTSATATDMYVILHNPVNSTAYSASLSTGSSSNKIKLTTGSVAVSGKVALKMANGQTTGQTYSASGTYKNTTTTNTSGTGTTTISCSISASAGYNRKVNGVNTTVSTPGTTVTSGSLTVYWTNPLSSIARNASGRCDARNYTVTSFSITHSDITGEKVTATFSNGATAKYNPTIASQTVYNVTNDAYYKVSEVTCSLTLDGVTKKCAMNVYVYNYFNSYSVDNQTVSFSSGTNTRSITGTATYSNGYTHNVAPNSATFTDQYPGTYSYADGTLTSTYTGSSWAYWTETPTFSYTRSSCGVTHTSTPTIEYYNRFMIYLYNSSSYSTQHKWSTGYGAASYLYVNFNSGNTTTYTTSADYYPLIKFDNGATKTYTNYLYTDSKGTTKITYGKSTRYLGGDSFVSKLNTTDATGSLQKVFLYYKLDGVEVSNWYYVLPQTTVTHKFETEDISLRHSNDFTHHVQPTCWKIYVRHYKICGNGQTPQVSYGFNYLPPNNNNQWYYYWGTGKTDIWFENVNIFDTGDYSYHVYKDGDTGQRMGMSGWGGVFNLGSANNGSYISYNMPNSITLDSTTCTPRVESGQYKDTWTWVTHCKQIGYN